MEDLIKNKVHTYYWEHDFNCATTTLKVLAETFQVELNQQVIDAATGMHGAGGHQTQCGLVEGTLMFFGVFGRKKGLSSEAIISLCKDYAAAFEKEFGSLSCKILRPQGFKPDNPPHLCEQLTVKSIEFTKKFIDINSPKGA